MTSRPTAPPPRPPSNPESPPHPPFRLLAISQFAGGELDGRKTAGGLAALPATGGAACAWFTALAAAGVDAVQLREKQLSDRDLLALAQAARAALPPPIQLLVNGRADVARAAAADGVHLPADGVPAAALRAAFGASLRIGVSTHTLAEVEAARDAAADYVVFGPVWDSPGKTADRPPAGADLLARAAACGIPVYALGGVTIDRFSDAAAAGAAGVAAIRLFQGEAPLPEIVDAARAAFRRPWRPLH